MGYIDYDSWKTASPYDLYEDFYQQVEVDLEIYNFNEEGFTTTKKTIIVDALLTIDEFEKESYVNKKDVENAVHEFLGKDCEYEIINWRRA